MRINKRVNINGTEYRSIKQASEKTGVSENYLLTAYNKLSNSGLSVHEQVFMVRKKFVFKIPKVNHGQR